MIDSNQGLSFHDGSSSASISSQSPALSACRFPQQVAVGVIGRCFPSSKVLLKEISEVRGMVCTGFWRRGSDAMAGLAEHPPEVVLVDIDGPEVRGMAAVSQIKMRYPAIQILAMTASKDTRVIAAAIKGGASGHLPMSATPGEVARAVKTVSDGGSAVSAEVARSLIADFHQLLRGRGMAPELTQREHEVMQCICRGRSNKEVACDLDITGWTVNVHLRSIFRKLSVHCRTEAAMKYRDLLHQPA